MDDWYVSGVKTSGSASVLVLSHRGRRSRHTADSPWAPHDRSALRVREGLGVWRVGGHGDVLCALYPQDEIVLHAFHRRVRGPVDVPALFDGLLAHFGSPPR
jgi:hypothetical protein